MSIGEYATITGLLAESNPTTALGNGGCGCGCGTCCGSELSGLERTRFFTRQLVSPDDLTQDQTYFRDKARRHNRLLHGWGIVCGARVKAGKNPCEIVVEPGYVLGPYGDEIVIDRELTVDLCKEDPTGAAAGGCGSADPWCAEVRVRRDAGQVMYLAVRYSECDTRPVRVAACGCGCDDTECEYSRTRDSFELKVLTELPSTYLLFDKVTPLAEIILLLRSFACIGTPRSCPPCPGSPWVILADVELDAEGAVTIDCASHRRYVASFGEYFFRCAGGGLGFPLLGQLTKESALVDTAAFAQPVEEKAPAPPPATVAAKTGDGRWLTIQGAFDVKPKETVREVLAREGDRTLFDTASGQTMTLREVYAAAGADPATKVSSVAEALAPLEGAKIDVAGLRVVRSAYDELIDEHGREHLEQTYGGSPAAAGKLPAQALRGVETKSVVGKHIAGMTVSEVAAVSKEAFVAAATKATKATQREAEIQRAEQVWTAASRVVKVSSAWIG